MLLLCSCDIRVNLLVCLNDCSLPKDPRQRPSVGNGYLATVVHGADMFLSGVYNGEGSASHRAAIPSTCSFVISGTEPPSTLNTTYELNVGAGTFLRRVSPTPVKSPVTELQLFLTAS